MKLRKLNKICEATGQVSYRKPNLIQWVYLQNIYFEENFTMKSLGIFFMFVLGPILLKLDARLGIIDTVRDEIKKGK